jgi:hypothetical protein
MNISRSLFLAMTGALASGACYLEPVPPPPPPPVAYAYPTPPPNYAPAPPPPAETSFVTPARPAYRYPYIVRRHARRVGVAVAEPGYRPPPPNFALGPSSEGVAPAPASDGPRPIAPPPATVATPVPTPPAPPVEGCLDTEPMAVPDCNQVRVEPSCGIRSFVMQRCNTYRTYMDSKVATAAVGCMANLTPHQLCDAENTYSCGKVALSEACEDTDLKQMCKIAASSCKTTANDCVALLSGLSDTGKQKIAECISHGCHEGLYSCVEGLK